MELSDSSSHEYPSDVQILHHEGRVFYLVGTAHISQESVELVQRVIRQEQPDCVCLELDDKRYHSLSQKDSWQALDLKQILKKKQLATLFISMLMASYQKRLGGKMGVDPGAELLAAAQTAQELQIPVSLCDRDVRVTLRRAWKSTSLFRKGYLLTSLLASAFDKTEISEEKLSELRKKDVLEDLMEELGANLPELKKVLIDERDIYLSEKIKSSHGDRVVAVVGAGHLQGIKKQFSQDNREEIASISIIPPVSKSWKTIGWLIPCLILGSLVTIGVQKGSDVAGANLLFWILANGIPSAIGSVLALGHPLTTLAAFLAAPITSLTPVIGAGYVTAFVQVMLRPPVVGEFESAGRDVAKMSGWWKNKLLRVFLIFFLTGLGSAVGTWVGGYEIVKNLVT
ncbi:TraB/GumN family protein [Desulfotalea psychrophila]|uniref:Related to pheromone shutdown protein TraB n=1 Tax=Desulfotalea psychrophila (strain LSv54 / DSM 12343) TaxID=177439 RepID=Q6AML9_DESPS|nr:TraB/GumN family protein [Desulfotalea psychrophila]CAG36406.1 related to pheromone shutdown protein TraB [Desulfotalea psychrophila LSv54]